MNTEEEQTQKHFRILSKAGLLNLANAQFEQLKERDAEIAALKEALGWALSEAGPFHDDLSCDLYDKYRKLL